jgi:acetyltransferase-like isoleucine patch superfamily enzyme
MQYKAAPATIGVDVLSGPNTIIMESVAVGERRVISAGAAATLKDISPVSVVAGIPARILKNLPWIF